MYIGFIYEPHGNPKTKTYYKYTQKNRDTNKTLKIVIKSQGNRANERNKKEL